MSLHYTHHRRPMSDALVLQNKGPGNFHVGNGTRTLHVFRRHTGLWTVWDMANSNIRPSQRPVLFESDSRDDAHDWAVAELTK